MQLGFLYRYIFVLLDEVDAKSAAGGDFRGAARPRGRRWRPPAESLARSLSARWSGQQRVHIAMLARGYRGQNYSLQQLHWHAADWVFFMVCVVYLAAARTLPLL